MFRGRSIPFHAIVSAGFALALAGAPCLAQDRGLRLDAMLAYQDQAPPSAEEASPSLEPDELDEPTGRLAFGEPGSWYWSVGGGVGLSSDSIDSMGQVSVGTFLTDEFEFNLALRGWYFAQDDGADAAGGSLALGFRWHFVQKDTYTVYAHAGIGILEASEDVPPGGTQFNFTPTIGIGSTIQLGEGPTRLDIGARWHHISNATTSGSDDNPARDGILLYVGFIFPF